MDPCKHEAPRVINNALINERIKEESDWAAARRNIVEDEEMPQMEEIELIRLEYLNILRIDHLWMLKSLRKLCLNNNYIEKIENLDELVNLVDLDLSFNKIRRIENLGALENLEKLSLYSNLIRRIENLDSQKKIIVLSLGKNDIDSLEDIIYLRQFPNLKSFNLSENPCTTKKKFRMFIAAFLPQLVYYEYKIVTDNERELGREKFKQKLESVQNEELRLLEDQQIVENARLAEELYSKSFVELLDQDQLFLSLFEIDDDGNTLLAMGEDADEIYKEYELNFNECTLNIFEMGQEQYKIRDVEVQQFLRCLEEARYENQQQSIAHMEKFLLFKAEAFLKVKNYQSALNNNDIKYETFLEEVEPIATSFQIAVHGIWKALMKLEMELFESTEEVLQSFEHTLKEMVNNLIEAAQAQFSLIRSFESTYQENISDCAERFMTSMVTDKMSVPDQLMMIMSDKEILQNALAASLDMHMQIIDNREDLLINRATGWLEQLIRDLEKEEITRNRTKVLEINHFLDIQREEFEDLTEESFGLDDDPDVTAALQETV